jgi:hypothetical protein
MILKTARTTDVIGSMKRPSNEIKWFALKENMINALCISYPTEEMINFIRNDNRFVVRKINSKKHQFYEISLKNRYNLNGDEMILLYKIIKERNSTSILVLQFN